MAIDNGFEKTAFMLLAALREMREVQRNALAKADWGSAGSAGDYAAKIEELLSHDSGECGLIALIAKRDPSAGGILASQLDRQIERDTVAARRGAK